MKSYHRNLPVSIPEITQKLLAAKKEKGLTFANLEKLVRHDEVWQATVFYERSPAPAL